ncbi:MAG: MFS transporter [Pseudomonadota bacterium]
MTERSDWRAIMAAFLVGVAGAIQVGRVAPVATRLQQDLHLDLVTIGWLVSLITLVSALLGLFAGHWVERAGLRTALTIGAGLIGICALFSAVVASVPALIATRIVEGIGYLFVVVAAPTLIARTATARDAPFALAIWGTFFTLGLSIAAFAGGVASEIVGWRGWFLLSAAGMLAAAAIAHTSIPRDGTAAPSGPRIRETIRAMPRASWLLGAAFLGLTLLALSILSLLPVFLVQEHGLAPGSAGAVTGSVALASIAGSLSYGVLANRVPDKVVAMGAAIALVAAAFPTFASGAAQGQVIPCAAVAVFMSGVLVAQTFAAVPRVAGAPGLIGPSNGLVAQLGSVGALTGPPLLGALIARADWSAVPIVATGFSLSFLLLFHSALRSAREI